MDYLQRIIAILTRYVLKVELDDEELALLKEWITESSDNMTLFDDLRDKVYLEDNWPSHLAKNKMQVEVWIKAELHKIDNGKRK